MYTEEPDVPAKATRVVVSEFEADWNDLPAVTARRARKDVQNNPAGCWYWNPRFTVHCPRPTRAFFRKARRCQAEWYQTMGRVLRAANSRREERNTPIDRDRRLTFGGLLVINGDIVDEKGWTDLEAKLGLRPEANVVVTRRPVDLTDLAKPERCEALRRITLSGLRRHLAVAPASPAYVTPGITVTGLAADAAFFAEARKREAEWHRRLDRKMGNSQRRQAATNADLATRMLIYHGVLVVDGLFYKPGNWPKPPNANRHAAACSDRWPTVSSEVLGFEPEETTPACLPTRRVLDEGADSHTPSRSSPEPGGTK